MSLGARSVPAPQGEPERKILNHSEMLSVFISTTPHDGGIGGEETVGKGKEAGTTVGQDSPLLGVSCLPHASHLISATANTVLSFPIMIHTHIHSPSCTHTHTHTFPITSIHTYTPHHIHVCIHTFSIVYIHAYIHKFFIMYIHTWMHAFPTVYTHACIHSPLCTYTHTCIPRCVHTCIPHYVRTYIPRCVHTCIHTYILHYVHACIHTYIPHCVQTQYKKLSFRDVHRWDPWSESNRAEIQTPATPPQRPGAFLCPAAFHTSAFSSVSGRTPSAKR